MAFHFDGIELNLNWLAVLLANVIGVILAIAWYADALFGKSWRQLTGITPTDSKKAGTTPIVLVLLANFVTSIVLAIAIDIALTFFQRESLGLALMISLLLWLAFSATTLLTHNAFELKPSRLTLINNGYQLTLFLGMGLSIGLLR